MPFLILGIYSDIMYQEQIYSEIPHKKEEEESNRDQILKKFVQGMYQYGQNLEGEDLHSLNKEK